MAFTSIIVVALVASTFAAPISYPVRGDVNLLVKRDVAYISSQHHASLTSVTKGHATIRKYRAGPAHYGLESIFDAFGSGKKRYKSTGTPAQTPLAHAGSGLPVLQVQKARAKYLHSSGKAHKHSRRDVPENDKPMSSDWTANAVDTDLEQWECTKSSSKQSNDNSLVHQARSSKCPPNSPTTQLPFSLLEPFTKPLNTGGKPPRKASKRSFLPANMEVTSFGQGVTLVRHRPASSDKQDVLPAENQVLHRRQLVPGDYRGKPLSVEDLEWLAGVKSAEDVLSGLSPETKIKVPLGVPWMNSIGPNATTAKLLGQVASGKTGTDQSSEDKD